MDFGTSVVRIGFAGEKQPQITIPATLDSTNEIDSCREAAKVSRWGLQLKYPVVQRQIEHWESLAEILQHVFEELKVNPVECRIILLQPFFVQRDHNEKLTKLFFDIFNIPAFTVFLRAILSLYQINQSTGLVIDIGEGYTSFIPVIEGLAISHAYRRSELSGRRITSSLNRLLHQRYQDLSLNMEIVQEIKDKYCYIAQNYTREQQLADKIGESFERHYELPDGQIITVNTERFTAPECLFSPSLIGLSELGLHTTLVQSIIACPNEFQAELFGNIILTGGTSQLLGYHSASTKRSRKVR